MVLKRLWWGMAEFRDDDADEGPKLTDENSCRHRRDLGGRCIRGTPPHRLATRAQKKAIKFEKQRGNVRVLLAKKKRVRS